MKSLTEIFAQDDVGRIVVDLKKKQIAVPAWSDLVKQYEPRLHEIMTNKEKYPDKAIRNEKNEITNWEKVTRVCIGLQKLSVKRITEFMFTTPINPVCQDAKSDATAKKQFDAVRKVLKKSKWNSLNKKRCKILSSECEQATYWYVADTVKANGKSSGIKLRYDLYSPSLGDKL